MNRIGIDVGSKTIKLVVIDEQGELLHSVYRKHDSNIRKTLVSVLEEYQMRYGAAAGVAAVTGSAGIAVARVLGLPFVQEVIATTLAVQRLIPQATTVVELGGEDAKIVYLDEPIEQRMNATCAGGTGSFIDSIADMLGIYTGEMSMFASRSLHTYPLASRCAVFAQTDVLPLLNAGVAKEDIAASALEAVVKQTIGGLACGRPLTGNVVFLGGPFQYLPELFACFCKALGLSKEAAIRPEKAHLFTARGAALYAGDSLEGKGAARAGAENETTLAKLQHSAQCSALREADLNRLPSLLATDAERESFFTRHGAEGMPHASEQQAAGPLFIGVDAGAAAVKVVALNDGGELVAQLYRPAQGNALTIAARALETLYGLLPKHASALVARSAVTGSGDETIQHALRVDDALVETAAHARAAYCFDPEASFVLDAGGQDMKALWLDKGVIVESALNDPCSSGLGSFMEETAQVLQRTDARFSELALCAQAPVDLDTKCTVFMNSRVRHAQKIGAAAEDIAAGVAYSLARSAYERLMSQGGHASFGNSVIVQGGVFKSDAVLRAFEKVSGLTVKRPREAAYMGAIGAALTARDRYYQKRAMQGEGERVNAPSTLISKEELASFDPIYSTYPCTGCDNACVLSLVSFGGNQIYISGNSCREGERVVKEAAADLGEHDILGSSSMFPRSRGMLRSRHHSEIGNGIVIPGYLRSFSGGMVGGGGNQGLSEAPRRIDYYANQLERDRTRERKIKIIPSTKYLSAEEVARKQQEEAKTDEQKKREEAEAQARRRAREALIVASSARTLRANEHGVPNVVAKARMLLADYADAQGSGARACVTIGIPAALAAFEQLPFWHTLFLQLGYSVAVSATATCKEHELESAEGIPAESLCEPAKILHARIYELAAKRVDAVFVSHCGDASSCPVSAGYAFVLKGSVPFLRDGSLALLSPCLAMTSLEGPLGKDDCAALLQALRELDATLAPTEDELATAFDQASKAQHSFREALRRENQRALDWVQASDSRFGMLLAMRPYHCDEVLLHGVDSLLERLDCAVLVSAGLPLPTGDLAVGPEQLAQQPLRFKQLSQYVAGQKRMGMLVVQSFNCGIDALSIDALSHSSAHSLLPLASVKVDEMADIAHMDVYLRTFVGSMAVADRSAEASALGDEPVLFARPAREGQGNVLAGGLQAEDIARAREMAPSDCCFTMASVLARTMAELSADSSLTDVHLPLLCKHCVMDLLPLELERRCGRVVNVHWDGDLGQGEGFAHAKALALKAEAEIAGRTRVGLVGNPLLCFDPLANERIAEMIEGLGAEVVMPNPRLLQVDDVRYLEQLQEFSEQGVDAVLYLQNANCLKAHLGGRGALHQFSGRFPAMPVTVLDVDPESSALNRENRIRLAISAATRRRQGELHDNR